MTDRLKFRAWCISENCMHYDAENTYDYICGTPTIFSQSFGCLIDNNDYIVEQCTGLKDKNGNLIYENDILYGQEEGDGETTAWTDVEYIVFFDSKNASFKVREKQIAEDSCWCDLVSEINEEYKIIGNIHENPELLNS